MYPSSLSKFNNGRLVGAWNRQANLFESRTDLGLVRLARIVILLALFVLGTPVAVMAATATDFLSATLGKTGAEPNDLPYRYLVPAGYSATNSYPLIVFLHGSGERGNNNTAQLGNNANGALALVSAANQTAAPCFMLAPQASVAEGWNVNTLAQVVRAIQLLESTYSIDANRIYVTGLSMGGAGTWDVITRYPFLFAAAIPMSGWGAGSYAKIVGLPIWAFHSADDGTVPVSGSDNAVSAVRQAGGRVIYTRYATGGHGIWPTAYANPYLRPWMLAQRRNQPMGGVPIVSIDSPGQHLALPPATSAKNVAGTASVPGGVTQVNWTFTPWVGAAGVDTSTYALASGTDNWSVANAPVAGNSTLFLAIATGSSWATGTGSATGGGITTLNDYFWNVPTGANLTLPSITLAAPANAGSLTSADYWLNLTGSATALGGKTVQAVTWRSDRGGEGVAVGTTSWSIEDIDLQSGDNVITVTVRDSSSITNTTTVLVHATADFGTTAPTITTQPANQAVTAGQSAGFSVVAAGNPLPVLQWQRKPVGSSVWSNLANGGSYSGATTVALTVSSTALMMSGDQFRCLATNSAGVVTSNAGSLTVIAVTIAPSNAIISFTVE